MRVPLYNVDDCVMFLGEIVSIQEIDTRPGSRGWAKPDYFIRTKHDGHMWVGEAELEPVELDYEGND